jgi:DNA polymerase-3 subunit alpha
VNTSNVGFELQAAPVTNDSPASDQPIIRFGLGTVKNVGQAAAESIVAARAEGGPFPDIEDFIKRADLKALNKRSLESLTKAGALDSLGDRGTLLANIDRILSLAQREAKLKETGQSTMFDMFGESVATPLPALEMMDGQASKAEMLSWEKELLGVYVSEHPFSSAAATTQKHVSALMSEITPELDGRDVVIAGMVNSIRHLATKAGKPFIAVMVEDLSGSAEVTVWSDVFEPTRDMWQTGNILLMQVRVRERNDRLQASVQQASLVQAADGTISHEHFAIPEWLTQALRDNAGVSVARVEHDRGRSAPPSSGGAKAPLGPVNDAGASTREASRSGPPEATAPPDAAIDADSRTEATATATAAAVGNGVATAVLEPEPAVVIEVPAAANGNGDGAAHRKLLRFYLHESQHPDADLRRLDALIDLLREYPGHDAVRIFIHAHDGDRIELTLPDADACDELRVAGVRRLGDGGGAEPIVGPKRKVAV